MNDGTGARLAVLVLGTQLKSVANGLLNPAMAMVEGVAPSLNTGPSSCSDEKGHAKGG